VSGDVWFNPEHYTANASPGATWFSLILHEIGHALGLSHPFEANDYKGNVTLPVDSNDYLRTVMSYTALASEPEGILYPGSYPQTLMRYDVAALEHLYEPSTKTTINNVWAIDAGYNYLGTIDDNGGIDTLQVYNSSTSSS